MIDTTERKAINRWGNSFLRPFVPYNLIEKSSVLKTQDDGSKLVYVKFLYGLKLGTPGSIPFDGTYGNKITNINEESLWLYGDSEYQPPEEFVAKNFEKSYVRTGTNRKCGRCSGQGLVQCSKCGGKIRWKETKLNGDVVSYTCSCGNGKENCGVCDGFGDTEDVIRMQTSFNVDQTKDSQYSGEVPEKFIKSVTGEVIYEQQFDYPVELVKKLLKGGISHEEMSQLNGYQLQMVKRSLEEEINDPDIDKDTIYGQLVSLFKGILQMASENKVLQREFLPVRVLIRVENAPVKQIDYEYKDKPYSIWLYGAENKIWQEQIPKSFNVKSWIILGTVLTLVLTLIIISL